LGEFSAVHIQHYASPWGYTVAVDLSEPIFGRFWVRTLPRLIDIRLVENQKEEGHVGRERDRQARGGGQGRRGQGRERHDRERGGGVEDRPGDPSDPGDPGEAMPEHEFRHRIREHLARIDERLGRLER